MNTSHTANTLPEAGEHEALLAWSERQADRTRQGADHLVNSSQPPNNSNAKDSAIDAASPVDSGAERSGPNCSTASPNKPSQTETTAMNEYRLPALATDAIRNLFVFAMFSVVSFMSSDFEPTVALFVFSLSAIAVVMIGVIAATAIIKSPAKVVKVSTPNLP